MKKWIVFLLMVPIMLLGADGGVVGYLQDSWKTIMGVLLLVFGGFWVPGLRTVMLLALKTLVSEKVLKAIFLSIAKKLVDSTKTDIDNIWLDELKKKI